MRELCDRIVCVTGAARWCEVHPIFASWNNERLLQGVMMKVQAWSIPDFGIRRFISSPGVALGDEEVSKPKQIDAADIGEAGCALPTFVPYSSKVPWHAGPRGFLSKLFPRYGNYCGPNYSSGRENGSLVWDKRPIDALDYCCYLHDVGYDTFNQADLYRADLAFLNCLERLPRRKRRGIPLLSDVYREIYILGLRRVLIPYRKALITQADRKSQEKIPHQRVREDNRKQML